MQRNVGTVDALMRITVGLTGVAWGISRMVYEPKRSMPILVTMASAMKVAEGVTRFCPMLAMMNTKSNHLLENGEMKKVMQKLPMMGHKREEPGPEIEHATDHDPTQYQ